MNRRLRSGVVVGGTVATALASAMAAVPAQAAEPAATTARTYTGTSVATPFGPVQVKVRVRSGHVVKVTAVTYPQNDPRSSQINAYAIPRLQQQAVAAQSATIAGVSGASWSSMAFTKSLQAALIKAGVTSSSGSSAA
jgi:uncharacterized protein with FMN-binding domain